MAITARSVVQRAADILKDSTGVRWGADELVRWLNEAQVVIVSLRPDASAALVTITLVAGTRQTIAATAIKLINVLNNAAAPKTAVRRIDRRVLDEQTPDWRSMTGVAAVRHFYEEANDPRAFYVYPPAAGGTDVEALCAMTPQAVSEPLPGSDYTSVTGNIGLPDVFNAPLLDYVLYRAFSKDSELTVNTARAQAHAGAFTAALGADAATTLNVPGGQ